MKGCSVRGGLFVLGLKLLSYKLLVIELLVNELKANNLMAIGLIADFRNYGKVPPLNDYSVIWQLGF